MIALGFIGQISAIFLTILLIAFLMIAELSNTYVKKSLVPLLVVLIVLIFIMATLDVLSKL